MFGKRPSHATAKAVAVTLPASVYTGILHPVHIGIFMAALLFGMNA